MKQRISLVIGGTVLAGLLGLGGAGLLAQTNSDSDAAWTTSWPALGEATSLILDPANPARLFAGTELGIAASQDGGGWWTLFAGSPTRVRALALDPSDASRLFGGSHDGVFLTSDGGAHFSPAHSFPTDALAIDPSQPNTVYKGGEGKTVRKSTDGGATWSSTTVTGLVSGIASLIVDPTNGADVLAGVDVEYFSYYYVVPALAASGDAGRTWRLFLVPGAPVQTVRATDGGARWTPGTFRLGSEVTSLAVDSITPNTLYVGTDHGVFRSTDAGAHWAPLDGPPNPDVRSLALDSIAQVLHAATSAGAYETALRAEEPSFPCQPSADALCLLGSRFRVRARAWDGRTGRFTTGQAVGESDGFGYFSLPGFTGDASLPEILVKMVNAEIPPWSSDWVFYAGLTDVRYLVTVTDTVTGEIRSYQNDPHAPYCGGADIAAFPASPSAGAARLASIRPLPAEGDSLLLLEGRFLITLTATDPRTGRATTGRAIAGSDRFGSFSLPDLTGDVERPEVVVKMVDARALSGKFWLFSSGLTSAPYTLSVSDTSTGEVRTYESPGAFCSQADTGIPGAP